MPRWMGLIPDQSPAAVAIISVALILACGFLMTRITKKFRLPNVTAYIVSGILMGPFCLNLIPDRVLTGTAFLPDIALAFIAFSTGEFFRLSSLKKNGAKVLLLEKARPGTFAAVLLGPQVLLERLLVRRPHPQMVEVAVLAYNAARENDR